MSSSALDLYQRHPLTVHDFHRMGEAGILPVEARLELIEGEIIAKAPIGSRHAAIVTRANMLFVQAVAGRAIVSSEPHHPRPVTTLRNGLRGELEWPNRS
jgi:hypothetical protein